MRWRIAAMCGASRGACAITVASTLPICQPAPLTRRAASASSASESAPWYCMSVSGKWWPMSPSAAAPNSASVIAWQSASASEWPSRPVRVRDLDAAEDELAARDERMRVPAFADAPERTALPHARRAARAARSASAKSSG